MYAEVDEDYSESEDDEDEDEEDDEELAWDDVVGGGGPSKKDKGKGRAVEGDEESGEFFAPFLSRSLLSRPVFFYQGWSLRSSSSAGEDSRALARRGPSGPPSRANPFLFVLSLLQPDPTNRRNALAPRPLVPTTTTRRRAVGRQRRSESRPTRRRPRRTTPTPTSRTRTKTRPIGRSRRHSLMLVVRVQERGVGRLRVARRPVRLISSLSTRSASLSVQIADSDSPLVCSYRW